MFVFGVIVGILIGWFASWAWYAYPDNREKFRASEARHRLERKQYEAEMEYLNEEIDETLTRRQRG